MQKHHTEDIKTFVGPLIMNKVLGYKPAVELLAALLEGINHFNFLPMANMRANRSSIRNSKAITIDMQHQLISQKITQFIDGNMTLSLKDIAIDSWDLEP